MGEAMKARLVWVTPEADTQVAYCARVSNPANQGNKDIAKLMRYCADHGHWSVFQMATACIEITSTRDITRQILRHWSMLMHELDAQEFSQRYQDVGDLPAAPLREARMQNAKNRQSSFPCEDRELNRWWEDQQRRLLRETTAVYDAALAAGIAKEVARVVLMEGLTTSRIYLSGNLRSWITFLRQRLDPTTQLEHRDVANDCLSILRGVAPVTMGAFFQEVTA